MLLAIDQNGFLQIVNNIIHGSVGAIGKDAQRCMPHRLGIGDT